MHFESLVATFHTSKDDLIRLLGWWNSRKQRQRLTWENSVVVMNHHSQLRNAVSRTRFTTDGYKGLSAGGTGDFWISDTSVSIIAMCGSRPVTTEFNSETLRSTYHSSCFSSSLASFGQKLPFTIWQDGCPVLLTFWCRLDSFQGAEHCLCHLPFLI
jgi:hypothetical protein